MEKTIIAVDPGSKGYITALKPNGNMEHYSISLGDNQRLNAFLERIVNEADIYEWGVVAVMEEVHAIFGSSASSTFAFGTIFGFLQGLFVGHKIPYHLVPPKTWQKTIWVNGDMVYEMKKDKNGKPQRRVVAKQTSYNAAVRLFPGTDFRRSASCRNFDDNKVDSILIAEYARRMNL